MNTITPQPIRLRVQGITQVPLSVQNQTVALSGSSEAHIIRGVSPTVDLEAVTGGTQMTVTDIDGEHTATIYNGQDGNDGQDGQDGADGEDGNGIASVELNDDYTLTITLTDGTEVTTGSIRGAQGEPGQDGSDGADGNPGVDGTSAYVHIKYAAAEPTQDSDMKDTADAWIGVYGGASSTAPTAYTSYTWYNIKGAAGADGQDGQDGSDGHSPVVTASKSGGITTVYVDGTAVATISDGQDGTDGQDGADGQDGHSPVVTASKSGGVTTISVDGTPIATVNDGQDGAPGQVQSIKMNGSTVANVSGVVDLGTVIKAHQDISGKADSSTVGTLSNLNTSAKTSLVAAVNEVNTNRGGTWSSLTISRNTSVSSASVNHSKYNTTLHLVSISCKLTMSNSIGQSIVPAIIAAVGSSTYYPEDNVPIMIFNSNNNVAYKGYISTNGNIIVLEAMPAPINVHLNVVYRYA